ncbi:MAG: SRPBCC family protein [Burkholderiales bacterium]|nr:SRPBCC family protein [Burkholderiales bacterium]
MIALTAAAAWCNHALRGTAGNEKGECRMTHAFGRRTGAACSRSLALSLAWIGLAAAAEVSVQVTRQDEAFQVEAKLMVAVDQRVAWQVLTDYGKLASFVPGMRSSRIVSAAGEPLLLEQKGESGFLLFRVPIEVVSRVEEAPLNTIRFQSVGGNLANKRGEWALERHDHATRIAYRANVAPGFPLPPLIGPAIVGRDVRIMVESVAREMLRRAYAMDRVRPAAALPAVQ